VLGHVTVTSFRRAGHAPSLAAGLVHFDVSFMAWVLLGALGAYVASDLGLSPVQKGLMVAVPPLGGSFWRVLLGSLADRVPLRRLGLVTLGLTLVPLGWGAVAGGSFGQVLGIGALLGVAGASFAVALPLVSRWYPPEHQGRALGIAGAGNSGTIVAALAGPRLAEHVGWHGVFALATIPVALAWLAFAVLAQEPPKAAIGGSPGAAGPLTGAGPVRMFAESDARWLCGLYAVTFGGFVGLSAFLPILFVDRFGLSKLDAAGLAASCAAAGSLLRPVGGWLADRCGGARVLGGVLTVVTVLSLVVAGGPPLSVTSPTLFAALGALGAGNGAVFQLVPRRFPGNVGAVTGLVGAAGGLGGFLLPFSLGLLDQATGSFGAGFLLFATAAAAAGVAVGSRQRAWRQAWGVERLEVAA
jgi:NNP family nitrate/nitrite transporter-like MFS transporter